MIQICFDCRKILLLISYITQLRLQLSSHPYDDKKEKFFGGESFHGTSHNWQSKPGGTGFNGRSKVEKVVGFSSFSRLNLGLSILFLQACKTFSQPARCYFKPTIC
jgi:hypothetical protein